MQKIHFFVPKKLIISFIMKHFPKTSPELEKQARQESISKALKCFPK